MKIAVIGIGSIGARHLENIMMLGYDDIVLVSKKSGLQDKFKSFAQCNNLAGALALHSIDAAIVCTPTAFHLAGMELLLKHHVQRIYLEKPVSHALEGVNNILEKAQQNNALVVVGYDLRFDPALEKINNILNSGELGVPVSANAFVGQYLPDWRPYEDYSKGMSAKKETGGGVLLDLVHEFDYLYHLFGKASSVAAHYKHSGSLDIETEDTADVLLSFENNVTATIHLDYLQPQLTRYCTITCTQGTINWNLALQELTWTNRQKQTSYFEYKSFTRNQRFQAIMKAFLEDVEDTRLAGLSDGVESLKMAMAAKLSSESGRFVNLNLLGQMPGTRLNVAQRTERTSE
ncbi:Gfo/Idh/MocA family protein [Foetidibacter luteolus]|uniref:Gfo/Idh/MocA family protein n=1 Tax=Foetidibacter luteolus TaxID=2608880 RepID=UPI00129B303D|nr:Gfo/Idh/MocA family oxidoreductase [Foetidibacter luteolus]